MKELFSRKTITAERGRAWAQTPPRAVGWEVRGYQGWNFLRSWRRGSKYEIDFPEPASDTRRYSRHASGDCLGLNKSFSDRVCMGAVFAFTGKVVLSAVNRPLMSSGDANPSGNLSIASSVAMKNSFTSGSTRRCGLRRSTARLVRVILMNITLTTTNVKSFTSYMCVVLLPYTQTTTKDIMPFNPHPLGQNVQVSPILAWFNSSF